MRILELMGGQWRGVMPDNITDEGSNMDGCVFNVQLNAEKTRVIFAEACDGYYGVRLTKGGLAHLIAELQEIHDQMDGDEGPV